MQLTIKIYISAVLIFAAGFVKAQSLNTIVDEIKNNNVVEYEFIGMNGQESKQYNNYLMLAKKDTSVLLKLLHNDNAVVVCYTSWALIDKGYKNLPKLFSFFLKQDKTVETFSGCIRSQHKVSNEMYFHYWNSVDDSVKSKDKMLFTLDSITLFTPNADWLLIAIALDNRVYPRQFDKQIEYLAFKKNNRDAILYLSNWYKAKYKDVLKKALINYLIDNNFRKVGIDSYYKIVNELLNFKDPAMENIILKKLQKDKSWKDDKEKFMNLLDDFSIYEFDIDME